MPRSELTASCSLEVSYNSGKPFRDSRTVTIDVTCDDAHARPSDCAWSEL